jgi:hypothetical protein
MIKRRKVPRRGDSILKKRLNVYAYIYIYIINTQRRHFSRDKTDRQCSAVQLHTYVQNLLEDPAVWREGYEHHQSTKM